ncbi:unnamed protein product [Urochloa decumbens]|uniref:Fungal lipase-type domain-containing protein n=1 Tax=Urochloa decumbens TaxID=240449 RepID=A0ABC8ZQW9_9POAL
MAAAASVISSSCPSLPISHRRLEPQIPFQQQPRRRPSSRHVIASVATTDRWAPFVTDDTGRGSQHAETSGRRSDDDDGQRHQQLAARWREIHGAGNWEGLLDPIDDVLRAELIRYGELAQATYDSFDYDRFSPYCGSCKFPTRTFFTDAGLDGAGYEVTRFLYATCNELKLPNFANRRNHNSAAGNKLWSESGTFIGYVAVSTDEETARIGRRDIAVAWRGTITRLEWLADLTTNQRPLTDMGIPCPDPRVKVESGFAELYTGKDSACKFCRYSAREQALAEVRKLVELYHSKGEEVSVTVTGHSLGSALAMLNAFDIAETGANASASKKAPVCVFSFAGPRVGNLDFKRRFETELGVRALRVVNVHDTVPKVPGVVFNEAAFPEAVLRAVDGLGVGGVYAHLGVPLALDHEASPFLKKTMDISCYHNLEAHLHLLDGFRGAGEGFEPRGRDPALVNKSADFLRDDHMVPPVWYQAENKGMVRTEDGRWVLPPRHRDIDQHPEDTEHHLKQLGLNAAST